MKTVAALSLCIAAAAAAPAPSPAPTPAPDVGDIANRAVLPIVNFSQYNSSLSALSKGPATAFAAGYTNLLSAISPSAAPTDAAHASATLSSLYQAYPSNPLAAGGALLLSGMTGGSPFGNPIEDLEDYGACNGYNNVNTQQPSRVIYPKASPNDAPYDVSEDTLKAAMYFPPGYTNGKVKPVIFIPGTGGEACEGYAENIGKLLVESGVGDPVYVNIPLKCHGINMLADEQTNAEFIAYAINFVAATTGRNDTAVITWSAGGPVTQWTFRFWPSTRNYVTSFIAVSPDFHGTIEVPLLCPPGLPCAPAVLQQSYNSNYINALRKNNGIVSYVPTTSIHTIFDEIVEPQQDPLASAQMGKGPAPVTNVQVQDICKVGTPAGGPNFGHENLLYNPVTYNLVVDAITHNGAANVQRAGPYNCSQFMSNGLTFSDVFATEALIPYAGFNIETYPNKTTVEPPIRPYAS